jgi:hypothetical protein
MNGGQAMRKAAFFTIVMLPVIIQISCGGETGRGKVIRKIPVDSIADIITRKNVSNDSGISSDGGGSLRIDVKGNQNVTLYRLGDIDADEAYLVYEAAVRTENLDGQAFLEMKCYFQSKGEFFSRDFENPLSGTNEWTERSTAFKLRKGENPDAVELGIYVSGKGTVWIDDIKLLKRPLK